LQLADNNRGPNCRLCGQRDGLRVTKRALSIEVDSGCPFVQDTVTVSKVPPVEVDYQMLTEKRVYVMILDYCAILMETGHGSSLY
jgi:hypothetical protein